MRKSLFSLGMILGTAAFAVITLATETGERPVYATIVKVERGDVHQVVAITGRVVFENEQIIYADRSGTISRVLADPGQRLASGEALVRLADMPYNDAINRSIAQAASAGLPEADLEAVQTVNGSSALRIQETCTIRELYAEEGALVTAGMPIARATSHLQEVRCNAAPEDAMRISQGMWAWLSSDTGEPLGFAVVETVGELTADLTTGLTSASIILRPEKHLNLPEYATVDADIYIAGSDDVLCLPIEAVTQRNTVWWVSDGRCTEIPAEIVMNNEMLAWVSLPEGMQVAIGEFEEGQRVVEAPEAAE